jgi:cysteine-rich repeat protein
MLRRFQISLRTSIFLLVAHFLLATSAYALDGGTLRLNTFNGWKAFEVISAGENPLGDGFSHSMQTHFDGAGAWLSDPSTLRVQVNHEVGNPASTGQISEVNLDLADLQTVISNMISGGTTGGVTFVDSARQAYGRWSDNAGSSFTITTDTSTTDFERFCSGQSYAPDTFGLDRGFVDEIYITGEEFGSSGHDRLFAIDSANRDIYTLSGVAGGPVGTPGIPFDSYENAALLDTGETSYIALLLSPDGGTQTMRLYIGEKGKDDTGAASNDFLARNGLAYGSWYWLIASYPNVGNTNNGSFSTSSSGSLTSDKIEDVDTNPSDPTQAVMGDQTSGVFTFDFDLDFSSGFSPGASSFTITKVANTSGSTDSLNAPDNVDWTDATTLGVNSYPDGFILVNEDSSLGEIWMMDPDGTNRIKIANTTVSGESTGILDISELVGYLPGSILLNNGQGTPSSMSILINPDATLAAVAVCGDSVVEGTEQCDDGGTVDGDCCSSTCTFETLGSSCDDGDACTNPDTCDGAGTCDAGAAVVCDDSLFCNGLETCDTGSGCQPGTPPSVDDGVACTDDSCDEGTDSIVNTPNNGFCVDSLFCNGVETCDAGSGCQPGTPPSVDDGVVCTDDSCDEGSDTIINVPNNGLCDDSFTCSGIETCDPILDCQAGTPTNCDDGDECTADSCDEIEGCVNTPIACGGPVPTSSGFGLLLLSVLMMGAGSLLVVRRQAFKR